jgi:hypothetical protein
MRIIIGIIMINLFPYLLVGQLTISPELQLKLKEKRKFSEIMKIVDSHYDSLNYKDAKKYFSEYKKWNRWAWWASKHQNENGEVDYSTSLDLQEALKRNSSKEGNFTSNNG